MTVMHLTEPIYLVSASFSTMTLLFSLSDCIAFFGNISDFQYPLSQGTLDHVMIGYVHNLTRIHLLCLRNILTWNK